MFRVRGKPAHLTGLKHAYKPLAGYKPTNASLNIKKFASSSTTPKKSNSSGLKIATGITLLCGGGLVGGAALYNYNADFRNYVNKSLPIIETFNLALGPVTNNNNSDISTYEEEKFSKAETGPMKPIIDIKKPTDIKPSPATKDAVKVTGKEGKQTAPLSSLDQAYVSSLDLDIAKVVEEEVEHMKPIAIPTPPPPAPNLDLKKAPALRDPSATVSAFDHAGVSSADLDIARSKTDKSKDAQREQVVEVTSTQLLPGHGPTPSKELSKEDVTLSKPIDTGLTDHEVESMVEQTAMEVLIQEGLQTLRKRGQEAIAAQHKATEAVLHHTDQLKHALEDVEVVSMKDLSKTILSSQKEAEDAITGAQEAQVKVNEEVEKFHILIKEAETAGAKEAGVRASEEAAKVSYGVLNATAELQKAKAQDMVLGEYQKFFDESRAVLRKELEEVMPGAAMSDKEQKAKGGSQEMARTETVLLAYARKRLEHLKQELAKHRQEEQKRLQQILSVQREEDNKLADIRLKQEKDKMMAEMDVALRKKESEMAAVFESDVRQQLRRQAAAYSDHLAEVLRVQAAELQERHREELEKKSNEEHQAFNAKLTAAFSRLRGVESAIDGRAEIEKTNKRSQELWLACQALTSAIDRGYQKRRPLNHEVSAVYDCSPEDPVVNTVLEAIPPEALQKGVYNEDNLTARFNQVRRQCRRVAMVGEDSAGPWTFLLSYLQSFFIFDKFDPRTDGELVDAEELDTFGLLARADYYIKRGDLELGARLVNQLTGEARKLAYDWLKETRILLETRQAVRLLSSYAAAAAMGATE